MVKRKNSRVKEQREYYAPTNNMRASMASYQRNEESKVHGLINPFSDDSRGSRIPDDNGSKSIPLTLRWFSNLASDSEGDIGATVGPQMKEQFKSATALTGTVITTWGTAVSSGEWTSIKDDISSYRVVSWGVRFFPTLAPTSQSGSARVVTVPTIPVNGIDPGQGLFEEVYDFPVANCDIHWVSKPIGNMWKEYIGVDETTSTWDNVVFLATGLPASQTCFKMEVFCNLECQPKFNTIAGTVSGHAEPHNPHRMAAANHGRINTGVQNSSTSKVLGYLKGIARSAITTVGSYVAPYASRFIEHAAGRLLAPRRQVPMIVD